MTTQPNAIKLANELDLCAAVRVFSKPDIEQAAAELRRLHKVNQELLKALKDIASTLWVENVDKPQRASKVAGAAIAKAEGEIK